MFGEKMIGAGMGFAGIIFICGIVILALDVGSPEIYRQIVGAFGLAGILVSAGAIWFWVSKQVTKPASFGEKLSAAGLVLACVVLVFVVSYLVAVGAEGEDMSDPRIFLRQIIGAFVLAGILALVGTIWSRVSK